MEAGEAGVPTDPAVLHVVEELKPKLDPVTVHSHNMEVKPVPAHPQRVLAVASIHVQSMEDGVRGALMDLAVLHVVEEQEQKVDPVIVHSHNMVVKPVQDQPQQVLAVTQTHVQ